MKHNYPYLNDTQFLKQITGKRVLEFYTKITILNWLQQPVEDIQGKVITASFNLDGNSAIRRTGNMSLIADAFVNNLQNPEALVSINKKVDIQVGFNNPTQKYTDYNILWFPLGLYVLTSVSITHSLSDLNISIQFKDKMCLLNGECGGTLPASVVFDSYETVDEQGNSIVVQPNIYQIIFELVNHFGGQQLGKIIISDIDTRIQKVMKWTGSTPLYFLKKGQQYDMTINASYYQEKIQQGFVDITGSPFSYGDDVGYIFTDFVYPGDLMGTAGGTVVDILENIKNALGNYEYFYDIDGNFIFQQIKNYLNNVESKYILDSLNNDKFIPDYLASLNSMNQAYLLDSYGGKSVFSFDDSNLVISYSNTPQYSQIKNDFVMWGSKKTPEGGEVPIRYHLAIDKKPTPGNTYSAFEYVDEKDGIAKWHVPLKFNSKANFPQQGLLGVFYYAKDTHKIYKWDKIGELYQYIEINAILENITTTDWRTELYFQGIQSQPYGTDSNYYYTELFNQWPRMYNIREGKFKQDFIKNPTKLNYYLDFIDSLSQAGQFSVENIGRRSYIEDTGTDINCIFEPYIPDIILIETGSPYANSLREQCVKRGKDFFQVPDIIYSNLEIGGNFNSAYENIRMLLNEYTSYNENISLQTLPMFFLQPNSRITVQDDSSGIFGDYIINTLSFSLDASSSLTINASRALEKI